MLYFAQRYLVLIYFQAMYNATLQRVIIFLVSDGKIKTDRVIVLFYFFPDDIVYVSSKLFTGVIGFDFKTADDQSFQLFQFTGALQVPEHPVYTVQVFARIFYKED